MVKNKIFIILSTFITCIFFQGQALKFRDKNLEKAVLENHDLDKNGFIDKEEASKLTRLFIVKKGVTTLEDLSLFPNVKMVLADDNPIPGISMKNMNQLEFFSCTGCQISTFNAENLKKLTSIYLDNNLIEKISLRAIPRIDQLTLSLNKLKFIEVKELRNLKHLNLEHNQLQQLDISGNEALQTLNVGGNKIKETDIKKGMKTDVTIFGTEP
ncbi:leucine-rich repeat domain-containing protein [Chryseobacterium tongliaoense]|uniref:leucine-rich repeat domain-containing protein n=1 Tax=Chryseobacterium tongliaoense TaxID=3240933 RepID=UPI0035163239